MSAIGRFLTAKKAVKHFGVKLHALQLISGFVGRYALIGQGGNGSEYVVGVRGLYRAVIFPDGGSCAF